MLANTLTAKLASKDRWKLLFCGAPGIGKTCLAESLALDLCGNKWGVETVNGRNVTIHVVRDWAFDFATSSIFGTGWKVKVVNEVDLCQKDAQDALLSFLDEMPAGRAFIGTSNLDKAALTERFRTRFERYEIAAPSAGQIAKLLENEGTPEAIARQIATLSGGNVRAALLDAEAWRNQNQEVIQTIYQSEMAV